MGQRQIGGPIRRWSARQRAQQEGIDCGEDGDICADGERESEDGNDGKASVAAEGTEGEAEISKGIGPVVGQTATAVHVLSYALAHALDGEIFPNWRSASLRASSERQP